ncbi:zincin-like metallopeptidase domain-containing protein [Bacillus sp. 491mf]|uniref:zincin-like metallopeptidase domain-containing protein n=1 Tax=Bacillus sp. 491mf TaxID=1761755 RepID=UPI001C42F61B|nr:zincin-like metallopeptidase domain-containing protein [Bacillus sp. 491mf]
MIKIGASMLTGLAGFVDITFDNSAAYIQFWLRNLRDDKTVIVKAASQAQKAVDYILGVSYNEANTKCLLSARVKIKRESKYRSCCILYSGYLYIGKIKCKYTFIGLKRL